MWLCFVCFNSRSIHRDCTIEIYAEGGDTQVEIWDIRDKKRWDIGDWGKKKLRYWRLEVGIWDIRGKKGWIWEICGKKLGIWEIGIPVSLPSMLTNSTELKKQIPYIQIHTFPNI